MFTVQVVDDSGIDELSMAGFEIFPNPSNGIFLVNHDFNKSIQYEIMDMHGKIIHDLSEIQKRGTIDLSTHPKGIYFIKVIIEEEIYTGKLLVR